MHRFSIIMPSLNQGRFLEQALQSVFLQQIGSVQIVVVDGGSDRCDADDPDSSPGPIALGE